jgi:hypothetical protein
VLVPKDVVLRALQDCGDSNFAAFMQTRGFRVDGRAYLDGLFRSVDWTDADLLNGAIAEHGPTKIGIATETLTGLLRRNGPPVSGWAAYDLPANSIEDQFASLFGYGSLAALVDLFALHNVDVNPQSGMPTGICYAMFIWGSVGIIDRQSLLNITGEAWVRVPTTIVKEFGRSFEPRS